MSELTQERAHRATILQHRPVDGNGVRSLALAAFGWLEANKQSVNALNVFPVPDGDTGTNMVLTMKSAIEEMHKTAEQSAGKVLEAVARGALMGARGNSGVILSQLWRGFARAADGKDLLTAEDLARGFSESRDTAYKGVVRPVEGTILTVSKDMATAAEEAIASGMKDPIQLLESVLKAADASVRHTPELLPILKEAGVVDSGGKGLYFLIEGMLRWVRGQQVRQAESIIAPIASLNLENSLEAVEEGQDYEVVVDFRPNGELALPTFYAELEKMGTSIQVGEGEGMFRMHIHVPTEKRYEPIDYIMTLGTVTNVAIENLMAQMDDITAQAKGRGEYTVRPIAPGQIAVVAVAPGAGIARHFADLGVAAIIEGGQTMNPSTADILKSFENLPTDKVVILPNNKNIALAAQSAAELTVKEAIVLPTTSVPQGLAAMLVWDPTGELEPVSEAMRKAAAAVQTGEVTTATRSVELDGVKVKDGQIIGLHNGKLKVAAEDVEKASLSLLKEMKFEDMEVLSIFYGEEVDAQVAESVANTIRQAYPDQEIEVQHGGQPHYQFIFAAE
ncbi:MAG: DAK2 domain-containing protein [Anaerolineales bacterium]|nr:MAG: DAK2 domain-containing protein [Anaerolineales bacterium]